MSDLKPVPQALALGTFQMCRDALDSVKQISVRTGHRDFTPGGTLVLYNEQHGMAATATITMVRHCALGDITEQEWRDDGFESQDELMSTLRGFYGDSITLESDATVVRWNDIKHPSLS